jgi:hypothetical protein
VTRRRAEALRRLGGPDLDKERKKNAMNGEQKVWALVTWAVVLLLGWLVWNIANYNIRSLEAQPSQPATADVLRCVNACATSCAASIEEGDL